MPTQPIRANRRCAQCGAELRSDALEGLCPRCVVRVVFPPEDAPACAPARAPTAVSATVIAAVPAPTRARHFGDYELLREIARGGMGVVFEARQLSLKRTVALKMLLCSSFASRDFVQRFHTEAEAAARLDHANIVPIYEIGHHEGQHYFSMKFIDGLSLAQELRHKTFPPRRAAELVAKIARAVHFAHQRGILHRDLKPGNVLLDAGDEPHVTDFGLAKLAESDTHVTQTNAVMGSPAYMSPEQACGQTKNVTTATDVYSLGAIFYELLTGRPPFHGESAIEVMQQVVEREPVPPCIVSSHIDRDLETICLKCLEKDPTRRYGSAEALADDLERWWRQEPVLARPGTAWERTVKWARRKPAVATLAGALLLVGLTGISGVIWQWRIAESARRTTVEKQMATVKAKQEIRAVSYASDMDLALRAYGEHKLAQAYELLQRQRPVNGELDLRGFEWRHLWWLCRGDYFTTLPLHKQVVGAMTFSPDGRVLATYAWNDKVRLWDLRTHTDLFPLTSPAATNAAGPGCFSRDGKTFILGGRDGSIRLCQTETGRIVRTIPNVGEAVAFAAHGNRVATIDGENVLKVLDLSTLQTRLSVPGATQRRSDYSWAAAVTMAADGGTLAVVEPSRGPHQADTGIRLWNVETGQELQPLRINRQIRCLLFSPEGKTLAVGSGDGSVTLCDLVTRRNSTLADRDADVLPVFALAFSRDGRTLATGGSDQTIKLWDVSRASQKPGIFRGQIGDVWSLAFSPDDRQLAAGSRDSPVRIWNVEQAEMPDKSADDLNAEHWGNFTFSPDSRLMAAGCKGTFGLVASLPGASFAVAFSQDGKSLLASSADETPQWWNVETKTSRPIRRYEGSVNNKVASVDLSPDRRRAALGHYDGTIELLEIDSSTSAVWRAHTGAVLSVAFSPLGDKLVSGGRDRSVAVWDVATQKTLASREEHRGGVCAVAFSKNGKMIASGCAASTIKFWKTESLMDGPVGSVSSHESAIRTLAFAPDGGTLASGSEDNSVKLWNVPLAKQVASFKYKSHVRLVAFSPDGNNLAVVTDNGTLTLLRAAVLEEADRNQE